MASRLLINAVFHTFNPAQPLAEAIFIRNGQIIQTGSNEEISALKESDSVVEDLEGQTVLPALSDAHIHLLEYGLSLQRLDCGTPTREECLDRIRQRAAGTPPGKWILGHGWNHNIWPEGIGNRQMLDNISSKHPIYLTHKSLHSGWANTAALNAAEIKENSENPQGGEFQRDPNGDLTGILLESAMRIMEKAIPAPDQSERVDALSLAQKNLLRFGITTVHDFDIWDCYLALESMEKSGQLKLRVIKGIPLPQLDEAISRKLKSGKGSSHLTIGWLKLFADGALGPQTAAMLEPFENSSSTGMLFQTAGDIAAIGRKALEHGVSLAIHAIGDRANQEVLDGYAQLSSLGLLDKGSLRPRIEHVQLINPVDIQRMASLGIIASMQPIHAPSDREMADRYWGERCRNAYAWKSIQASGADLIFGSDAPVESPNPFWGLYAATARKALHPQENKPGWYPQQRLSFDEALQAYITAPHKACGWASRLGRIQVGRIADLIVFAGDPFQMDPEEIHDILPEKTMCDGLWVV